MPLFSTQRLSQGESRRGGGFAAQKGSQPRLAALGSPFQGKGLAWSLPPSYGRRCPEGAEVGWEKRYEKEQRRSSQVRRLREHPSAAARFTFPNGEGCDTRIPLFSTQHLSQGGRLRGGGFAAQKGSQPHLAALDSPFQGKGLAWTLPPSYGRRCPEGAEVGWGKQDEKIGEDRLKYAVCESTLSTADAVPLPQWGRLRYEDTAFLASSKRIRIRGEKE